MSFGASGVSKGLRGCKGIPRVGLEGLIGRNRVWVSRAYRISGVGSGFGALGLPKLGFLRVKSHSLHEVNPQCFQGG